ncbi:MAG TPA: DUF1501 domain-containing protein [Aquabacterium sp.]|nr:DUF1501 domain-containing protein [Aquabacterium sp.]
MPAHPLPDRRFFLRSLGALSALALHGHAWAQSSDDYKALVCVFLHGGNDAYNTVLATDAPSWKSYVQTRRQDPDSIALDPAGVHDLDVLDASGERQFALNPGLSGLSRLFNDSRRLAIVSNVGPMRSNLTKAQYAQPDAPLPAKLFSHNDQQSTWLSFGPEGTPLGWGGLLADRIAQRNANSLFTAVSAISSTVWLTGRQVRPYQLSEQGSLRIGTMLDPKGTPRVYGSDQVARVLDELLSTSTLSHVMAQDWCAMNQLAMDAQGILADKLPGSTKAPFSSFNPSNPLSMQLQTVARMASIQKELGIKRQLFFVSLYGFDTHDRQNQRHLRLMQQLDEALCTFDSVLGELNLIDRVTTFTASDFGRTFTSNGDGTDHGWGGHHFVMGGAVRGGRVLGRFPAYAMKSRHDNEFPDSPDQLSNGVLLPSLSTQAYARALGSWFGIPDNELVATLPDWDHLGVAGQLSGLFKA